MAGDAGRAERLHYLDWLRSFAVLAVFFGHCAKIFDFHTITVYNAVRSPALSIFREFYSLWIMPLFFIIAGASVYFSLSSRDARGFVRERILRILIPLIFVGTFIINPPYIYVERLFTGQTADGFFQWYPQFFHGLVPQGNFAPLGLGTHLWFLQALLIYSLMLLPLFVRSPRTGQSPVSKSTAYFESPWALFLLFIPISAAAAAVEFMGLGFTRIAGGWDPASYLLFFIYGYLVFSNAQMIETMKKYAFASLIAACVLTVFYLDSHFGINLEIPGVTRHNIHDIQARFTTNLSVSVGIQAFRGLIGWLWLIGILGLCRRFLNFSNRPLTYFGDAGLPFYILHHTVILIVGFYIIQWNSSILIKYIAIAGISFIVIMAIYELLIRRFNPVRFLFGMKKTRSV